MRPFPLASAHLSRHPTRRLALLAAALAASACQPGYRTLEIRPTTNGMISTVPPYITSGDSLEVIVRDRDWSRVYVANTAETARQEVARAPVFGLGTTVSGLTKSIPLSFLSSTSGGGGADRGIHLAGGSVEGSASAFRAMSDAPMSRTSRVARLWAEWRRLNALRDTLAVAVDQQTGVVRNSLDALHHHLAGHPAEVSALRFMIDLPLQRALLRFANDPTARGLQSQLALAMAVGRPTLDTLAVTWAMQQQDDYLRQLRALAALVPPIPASPGDDGAGSLTSRLEDVRSAWKARESVLARYNRADSALMRVGLELRRWNEDPPPAGVALSVPVPELRAAGVDLDAIFAAAEPGGRLEQLREAVFTIDANTRSVVSAAAQLPAWAVGPDSTAVFGHVFHGSETLTVTVKRRPRYVVYAFAPDTGSAADPGAAAARTPVDTATVGEYRMLVAERFRFHVGAGFVYSPLQTRKYASETVNEGGVAGVRVREADVARNAVFPALVVSYAVFPTAGRVLDGSADRNRFSLQRAGISIQAGMSLQNPTEQLYFGLSTEPFPGLSLGGGYSLAYLERSRRLGFVPDSEGSPVRKRWLGKWGAFSMIIDTDVFFKTIGVLLH